MANLPFILPEINFNAGIWILWAISTVTTVVRLYCRGFMLQALGVDDVLMSLASVCHYARSFDKQQSGLMSKSFDSFLDRGNGRPRF